MHAPCFTCGNNITDIRDNKVYPTVQIGSQCWMASNLNFGTIIASTQDQRDNCVSEKYCYNDNPINCTNQGGLYQWDELMQYDNTPADQGFCPPAWHIPTENDWNTLFANYTRVSQVFVPGVWSIPPSQPPKCAAGSASIPRASIGSLGLPSPITLSPSFLSRFDMA